MASPFQTEEDLANRALQRIGAQMLASGDTLAAPASKNSAEIAQCYDKLRVTELSDHLWLFAIKKTALRALDWNTGFFTPAAYSSDTTYMPGAIVSNGGAWWTSNRAANTGNTPGADGGTIWQPYFGPRSVSPYDTTGGTEYYKGELVYYTFGAGYGDYEYSVYVSLSNNNSDDPTLIEDWLATKPYYTGQLVSYNGTTYQSKSDFNLNNTPNIDTDSWTVTITTTTGSNRWLKLTGATAVALHIEYPLDVGPLSDTSTRNAYLLPAGFLRKAPQAPKQGLIPLLGAPSGPALSDWVFESDMFTTAYGGTIVLRFVADFSTVAKMDPCFCEALAAKIAVEVCESLTQSAPKLQLLTLAYKEAITTAATLDGIERGPSTPATDVYIAVRV